MDFHDGYIPRSEEIINTTRKFLDDQDVVITFVKHKCRVLPEAKGLTPEQLYTKFAEHSISHGRYQKSLEKFTEHLRTVRYLTPSGTRTNLVWNYPTATIPQPLGLTSEFTNEFNSDEEYESILKSTQDI